MLACASTTPPPDTAIALHSVGSSASIENGNVRFWSLVATAKAPTGQAARPMMPAEDRWALSTSIWTSMKPGNPA